MDYILVAKHGEAQNKWQQIHIHDFNWGSDRLQKIKTEIEESSGTTLSIQVYPNSNL